MCFRLSVHTALEEQNIVDALKLLVSACTEDTFRIHRRVVIHKALLTSPVAKVLFTTTIAWSVARENRFVVVVKLRSVQGSRLYPVKLQLNLSGIESPIDEYIVVGLTHPLCPERAIVGRLVFIPRVTPAA